MFDKDGKLNARSQAILAEQTIPPRYGISPGMQAAADLRAFNELPPELRAQAIASMFDEMQRD